MLFVEADDRHVPTLTPVGQLHLVPPGMLSMCTSGYIFEAMCTASNTTILATHFVLANRSLVQEYP
jgi:hypothetical protein